MNKIIVCSKSEIKLNAVKEAFGTDYKVIGVKSLSGIPEQPYGAGQTMQGAFNRINSSLTEASDNYCTIAIENGIVPFGVHFIDLACIACKYKEKEICLTSTGVPVTDADLVRESVFNKHQEVTVGDLMAKKYSDMNSKDPHKFITNGTTRQEIIVNTLKTLKKMLDT